MRLFIGIAASGLLVIPVLLWPHFFSSLWSGDLLGLLMILISFPHFVSSYFLVFRDPQIMKSRRFVILIFPLMLFCVALLAGILSEAASLVLLQSSYLFLHWHFAKQVFGVSLWFQKKAPFGSAFRSLCLMACLSVALYGFIGSQATPNILNVFKSHMQSLYWKTELVMASRWLMMACTGIYLVYSIFCLAIKFSWFRVFSISPMVSFFLWIEGTHKVSELFLLLPILHGLQYLPFVGLALKGQKLSNRSQGLHALGYIILGWFFFRAVPEFMGPLSLSHLTGAGILFVILNVHHFFVDTILWRSHQRSFLAEGF